MCLLACSSPGLASLMVSFLIVWQQFLYFPHYDWQQFLPFPHYEWQHFLHFPNSCWQQFQTQFPIHIHT
jgi:hypothetical protein